MANIIALTEFKEAAADLVGGDREERPCGDGRSTCPSNIVQITSLSCHQTRTMAVTHILINRNSSLYFECRNDEGKTLIYICK